MSLFVQNRENFRPFRVYERNGVRIYTIKHLLTHGALHHIYLDRSPNYFSRTYDFFVEDSKNQSNLSKYVSKHQV